MQNRARETFKNSRFFIGFRTSFFTPVHTGLIYHKAQFSLVIIFCLDSRDKGLNRTLPIKPSNYIYLFSISERIKCRLTPLRCFLVTIWTLGPVVKCSALREAGIPIFSGSKTFKVTCRNVKRGRSYNCSLICFVKFSYYKSYFDKLFIGNFLENDFRLPPLLSILYIDIIDLVAAAPGPLACPSPSARPINCLNLT